MSERKLPIQAIVDATEAYSLEELTPLWERLGQRAFQQRLANNGLVPLSTYAAMVAIGGVYVSIEMIPRLVDEGGAFEGFLLKMREEGDQGWENLWHIPGTALRLTDDHWTPFRRLAKEIFGRADESLLNGYVRLGDELHKEFEERAGICLTVVNAIDVRSDDSFPGEWQLFTPDQLVDERIVDHHRNTLRWAMDPHREPFVLLG